MKRKGLFGKYLLAKADGSPLADGAKYFVLRYDCGTDDITAIQSLHDYACRTADRKLGDALLDDIRAEQQKRIQKMDDDWRSPR